MGSTTALGYPFPVGTDRVMDGDDAIKALAEAADTKAGVSAAGTGSVTLVNSATGVVTVTFPAGRFTVPPVVVANVAAASVYFASPGTTTATSCAITARHSAASLGSPTLQINWFAHT